MYSVHAVVFKTLDGNTSRHEVLIHDTMSPIHEHHLIDPKLSMADLEAGKFTATVPPYNPGYSLIERFNTIIKVHKGTKLIWTGRIITESSDFWNRRTINCEGALAFLNDTVQPIASYGSGRSPAYILSTILNIHNSKTVVDREIYPGSVDDFVTDDYGTFVFETNNETTFEALKKNIVDRLDCHISMHYTNNKAYLDIYSDYPNTAVQQINFGDNLLDFTKDWNLSGLVTVILPRGKQIDTQTNQGQTTYLTLKSSNADISPIEDGTYSVGGDDTAVTVDGPFLINNALYSQYGRVEKVVDFNDSEDPQDLFILAKNYITSMQFDNMTLKVNAVDLHNLTKEIVSFELLDQVYCISKPHGLYGRFFPIVEMDIPLDHPESVTYTLTDCLHKATLSGSLGAIKGAFGSVRSGIDKILSTTNGILDLAKVEASSIINRKTTGYVSIINMHESEEEGIAQAIVISNLPNWQQASKYWIWNMNGLAYYDANRSAAIGQTAEATGMVPKYSEKDGDRYYDLAITMDGTIIANRIKTGIISDGLGYNYWNLETGAFSLTPGASVRYGMGDDQVMSMFDLIYGLNKSNSTRTGSANYLKGTRTWEGWEEYGYWYIKDTGNSSSDDSAYVIANNPDNNPDNLSGYKYLISPSIDYGEIKGNVMTFSIEGIQYIKGNSQTGFSDFEWGEISADNCCTIIFKLIEVHNHTEYRRASFTRAFSFDTDNWCRRYVTVDMINSSFDDYESNPYLQNDDAMSMREYIIKIVIMNSSNHFIGLCKPQFERGNTPTDWAPSEVDINKNAEKAAVNTVNTNSTNVKNEIEKFNKSVEELIAEKTKDLDTKMQTFYNEVGTHEWTDGQIEAFEQELNMSKLLDALTDGGKYKTIYYDATKNQLLINADYIKTGALNAALLTTGTIKNKYNMDNYWDLVQGYAKFKNAEFKNATVSGQLSSDNGLQQIELTRGGLSFYWENKLVGKFYSLPGLPETGTTVGFDGDKFGLTLNRTNGFWVHNTNNGKAGFGQTCRIKVSYLSGVNVSSGNCDFAWIALTFVHGVLVGFEGYDPNRGVTLSMD